MTRSQSDLRYAWIALFVIDVVITLVTLVVFGVMGGFFLLVALNGFTTAQSTPVFIGYYVFVFLVNVLATFLANLLIRKLWRVASGLPVRAALVPALVVTVSLMVVGPPLAVALIKLAFSR